MNQSKRPDGARPIGYFVHHQGRGHAERCADLVNALPDTRPVEIFCARDDIFPPLRPGVSINVIPSLFEPSGAQNTAADWVPTPSTLHCAPLGWPGIRRAMAKITAWFDRADPALMICDVSAEIAQLSRICSVPHVNVVQHGDRSDPGHQAAYDGAAGLLVPFHARLAQSEWPASQLERSFFAPGLGIEFAQYDQSDARTALKLPPDAAIGVIVSGAGGTGFSAASLGLAARSFPNMRWIAIGDVQADWHATLPSNLELKGWVTDAARCIAAADLIISSAGNTVCHQILAASKPWIVVPEWRYFDEQKRKAEALGVAGAAVSLPGLPASAQRWQDAVAQAFAQHDPVRQRSLVSADSASATARWIEDLIARLWNAPLAEATTSTISTYRPETSI